MKKDNKLISVGIFLLMLFTSLGWYTAETDNEILRKELSYYTGQEIRK